MNFGFWNINDQRLDHLIFDFVDQNDLDVLILGESPYQPSELLLILNQARSNYYYAPGIVCDKIQFFTKFKPDLFPLIEETTRISARSLFSAKYGEIILIAAHYNSKVNWSSEDQAAHTVTFKEIIDNAESKKGHKKTVICGDLNMNPFDAGMVQSTGLHAVMEKRIAQKICRTIDGREYDYFYNPMWSFLGDDAKGNVSGSIYYSPAKPINYHWHIFDQVLIRPELIQDFKDDELDIVTTIKTTNLLTSSHLISKKFSDHLPIKFQLSI